MKKKIILRVLFVLLVVVTNISCDRISKNIVRKEIAYGEKIHVINDFLVLTKVENKGAFLSLGNRISGPVYHVIMIIIPIIVLGGVLFFLFKYEVSGLLVFGLSMIIGGGAGNIFDRIKYGSVTDFMHMDLGIFKTGIFNMADLSIMTGLAIILFEMYFNKERRKLILR